MSSPPFEIDQRTYAFSLRVLRLCREMDAVPGVHRTISRQLLRAGTSVGANVEEAQAAQSRADFISKMNIALKEARETHYWLRLIRDSELVLIDRLTGIIQEADEIKRILGAIVHRSRENC
jgi:four helix bundle protein